MTELLLLASMMVPMLVLALVLLESYDQQIPHQLVPQDLESSCK